MVTGIATTLFEFQEEAVIKLLDLCSDSRSKQTIIMKAPTGSGKTIILIDYVDEYLNKIDSNTAFIWLCPGKGNLEEQSREKMRKFAPHLNTQNLFEALENGFPPESITFINWELVTKEEILLFGIAREKIYMTILLMRIESKLPLLLLLMKNILTIQQRRER